MATRSVNVLRRKFGTVIGRVLCRIKKDSTSAREVILRELEYSKSIRRIRNQGV